MSEPPQGQNPLDRPLPLVGVDLSEGSASEERQLAVFKLLYQEFDGQPTTTDIHELDEKDHRNQTMRALKALKANDIVERDTSSHAYEWRVKPERTTKRNLLAKFVERYRWRLTRWARTEGRFRIPRPSVPRAGQQLSQFVPMRARNRSEASIAENLRKTADELPLVKIILPVGLVTSLLMNLIGGAILRWLGLPVSIGLTEPLWPPTIIRDLYTVAPPLAVFLQSNLVIGQGFVVVDMFQQLLDA